MARILDAPRRLVPTLELLTVARKLQYFPRDYGGAKMHYYGGAKLETTEVQKHISLNL